MSLKYRWLIYSAASIFSWASVFVMQCEISYAEGKRVTLRADLWPPFTVEPESEKPGALIEIIKAIFEENGILLDYAIMPWSRALKEAEVGKIDGVVGSPISDAPSLVFPDLPQGQLVCDFIVRADSNWTFESLESLRGVKLGVLLNYTYGELVTGENIDEYIEKNKGGSVEVIGGDSPLEVAAQMLQKKRIDVILENKASFKTTLKRLGINEEQFRYINGATKPQDLFVAFSPKLKNAQQIAHKVSEGTRALRSSGALQKILDRYGLVDWESS